jgi:hypothetical protein
VTVNHGLSSYYQGLLIKDNTLLTPSLDEFQPFLHGNAFDIGHENWLKLGKLLEDHDDFLKFFKADKVASFFSGVDSCFDELLFVKGKPISHNSHTSIELIGVSF